MMSTKGCILFPGYWKVIFFELATKGALFLFRLPTMVFFPWGPKGWLLPSGYKRLSFFWVTKAYLFVLVTMGVIFSCLLRGSFCFPG